MKTICKALCLLMLAIGISGGCRSTAQGTTKVAPTEPDVRIERDEERHDLGDEIIVE